MPALATGVRGGAARAGRHGFGRYQTDPVGGGRIGQISH